MNPDCSPTLQDVARAAGLSVATVSRALRNHPAIPAVTRERVQAAATRLGYQSNPLINALMEQVRNRHPAFQESLACLHSRRGWEHDLLKGHEEFLAGMKREGKRIGYGIDFHCLEEAGFCVKAMLRSWRLHRVRGVVLFNYRPESALDLPWQEFAWVVFSGVTHAPKLHRVGNEIFQITKVALKELAQRGYRRPGLAIPMGGSVRMGFRWVGAFVANAMHYGLTVDMGSIFRGEWNRDTFAAWHDQLRPDVILGLQDQPKHWLEAMGKAVPDQVGFLHLIANISKISATGVAQNFDLVGKAAVQALDAELRRNDFGIPSLPITSTVAGVWREGTTLRGATADPPGEGSD